MGLILMEMNFSALFLDTTALVNFDIRQCGKDRHIYLHEQRW